MDANLRPTGIDRRTALRRLTSTGVALAASASWVDALAALARQQAPHAHATIAAAAQTATGWKAKVLNAHQLRTVGILSELIIPKTDTPGAMDVHVDRFIDTVLAEASPPSATRSSPAWRGWTLALVCSTRRTSRPPHPRSRSSSSPASARPPARRRSQVSTSSLPSRR